MRVLSESLFVMGTWLFLFRLNVGPAKLTEYVYSVAILCFVSYLLSGGKLIRPSLGTTVSLWLAFSSVVFATSLLSWRYGIGFTVGGSRLIVKYVLNLITFIVMLTLFKRGKAFYRRMTTALTIPMLAFGVLPFLPEKVTLRFMDEPGGRFVGFEVNPAGVAYALILAFGFMYARWLDQYYRGRALVHFKYLLFVLTILVLLLWSGSRIALISTLASTIAATYLTLKFGSNPLRRRSGLRALLVLAASTTLVVAIARATNHFQAFDVVFGRVFGVSYDEVVQNPSLLRRAYELIADPRENIRIGSMEYYWSLVKQNPFGLGVNYFDEFGRVVGGEIRPPDSFLDTLIHGGFVLAISMSFLTLKAFRSVVTSLRSGLVEDNERAYIIGSAVALVGNCVVTIFGGFPIYELRFWIVLALCLGLNLRIPGKTSRVQGLESLPEAGASVLRAS